MRIAVISTMGGPDWGGSEELWAAMAHEALASGDQVLVSVNRWSRKPEPIVDLEEAGARVVTRSRLRQRARHRASSPLPLPAGLAPLRRFAPDVVCLSHGATWDVPRDPGLQAGLERVLDTAGRPIPYIALCQYTTEVEPLTEAERARARRYFGGAAAVAFVSEANRASAERQLAEVLRRAVIVQNPVTRHPARLAWPGGDTARFACVARLEAGAKGQDLLLTAFAGERWRDRDWELSLVGAGPHEGWLRALAAHHGLTDRVRFCGHLSDIEELWRAHHVLLLASRAEGTPLSLLEAMALGRPAVVTAVGGNADWVDPGVTGYVAAAATVDAVAAALDACWDDRPRWSEMGAAAHEALVERADPRPGRTLLRLVHGVSAGAACSPLGGRGS